MKVLLIDVDSTVPNVALMKLSTYWKEKNARIILIKIGISYYPDRKKKQTIDAFGYDKVFVSSIFYGNGKFLQILNNKDIEYGGTGYSITKKLPLKIEKLECDYSIYPENNISYGFITRGCIRNCKFCCVSEKEGNVHQVGTIDSVVHHKKVIFLDNNILAWSGHLEIFKELIRKSIKCGFNQGLDVRLVTEENAELLSQINWLGEYIFAFDYLKNEKSINRGLKILKKYILKKWQLKFYLYCHPDMDIKNDVLYRIDWCRYNQVLPYLMRDISCWGNKKQFLYTDLAAWCNQPGVFKQIEAFEDFIIKRHLGNLKRAYMILELYNKEL